MTGSRELLRLPDNKVIACFRQVPSRSLRQIWCFAQAGGGAWEFAVWSQSLKSGDLLCAVRLPGRERRFAEQFATDIRVLSRSIAADIGSLITGDAVFYGQCLGALIAFEVAVELGHLDYPRPKHLFVASSPSPRYAETATAKKMVSLDDADFRDAVRGIGGLPEEPAEVENSNSLWDLAAAALRADFRLLGNYIPTADQINVGITALTGTADHYLRPAEVADWQNYSSAGFSSVLVSGGRFLTRSPQNEALSVVQDYPGAGQDYLGAG